MTFQVQKSRKYKVRAHVAFFSHELIQFYLLDNSFNHKVSTCVAFFSHELIQYVFFNFFFSEKLHSQIEHLCVFSIS
jgi:hypothetical protein